MEIADTVVERLCLSLIIPVVRPNTIKVLSHILCSAQSKKLFNKIEIRLPNVIKQCLVQGANIAPDFQLLVDLVSVFVNRFPIYNSQRDELVSTE